MNKISRKGFLKIAAAAAMSGVTAGALAACNSASSSSTAASAASGTYIPGTYEGTAEGISSPVKVTMTFSDSAVTNVVVDTSGETASYGAAAADQLKEQLLAAGSAEIDGVSGSTVRPTGWARSRISTRLPSPRPWTPTSSSSVPATAACLLLLMQPPTA